MAIEESDFLTTNSTSSINNDPTTNDTDTSLEDTEALPESENIILTDVSNNSFDNNSSEVSSASSENFVHSNNDIIKEIKNQNFNFFLIHLNGSTMRYNTVVPKLNNQGIEYKIVGVNGTEVEFWHNHTNIVFTGKDLVSDSTTIFSNGKHQLSKFQIYNVTCDPKNAEPTKFVYNGFSINAGQIGQLCSHVKCWQEAKDNNYEHTVIITDNALPSNNLKNDISYLINNSPKNYDFIYLALNQTDGGRIPVNGYYLEQFTPDARFNNVLGVIISQSGINKLLTSYDVPFNADTSIYYYEISTCYKGNWNIFCGMAPFFREVNAYVSTIPSLSLYDPESVMGTMGEIKDVLEVIKPADTSTMGNNGIDEPMGL